MPLWAFSPPDSMQSHSHFVLFSCVEGWGGEENDDNGAGFIGKLWMVFFCGVKGELSFSLKFVALLGNLKIWSSTKLFTNYVQVRWALLFFIKIGFVWSDESRSLVNFHRTSSRKLSTLSHNDNFAWMIYDQPPLCHSPRIICLSTALTLLPALFSKQPARRN